MFTSGAPVCGGSVIWFGVVGAVAMVVLVLATSRRNTTAWCDALARRASMGSDSHEWLGAAWIRGWYLSTPLVRIAARQREIVIMGRWRWLPLRATVVARSEVQTFRVRQRLTGYDEIDLAVSSATNARVRFWLRHSALTTLQGLGWLTS